MHPCIVAVNKKPTCLVGSVFYLTFFFTNISLFMHYFLYDFSLRQFIDLEVRGIFDPLTFSTYLVFINTSFHWDNLWIVHGLFFWIAASEHKAICTMNNCNYLYKAEVNDNQLIKNYEWLIQPSQEFCRLLYLFFLLNSFKICLVIRSRDLNQDDHFKCNYSCERELHWNYGSISEIILKSKYPLLLRTARLRSLCCLWRVPLADWQVPGFVIFSA